MNTLERPSPVFLWLMAWLLAFLVSACGGGGEEGGVSPPQVLSTNSAPAAPGTQLTIDVRGRKLTATVATMPFVPHRYHRKGAA